MMARCGGVSRRPWRILLAVALAMDVELATAQQEPEETPATLNAPVRWEVGGEPAHRRSHG